MRSYRLNLSRGLVGVLAEFGAIFKAVAVPFFRAGENNKYPFDLYPQKWNK